MVILYISSICPVPWAGPTYSVPKQIAAQKKLDDVYWVNLSSASNCEKQYAEYFNAVDWKKLDYYYETENIFPIEKIEKHFGVDRFDMIVCEQFYCYAKSNIVRKLPKAQVPYVIIPRGELTVDAQKKKALKKKIANLFVFRDFYKKASAIQYLTEQERKDSGKRWNNKAIVVGNGVDKTTHVKENFLYKNKMQCIMIGRLDPFHKGIDLLLDACADIADDLRREECTFKICGPDRLGKLEELKHHVATAGLSDVILFSEALYGEDKERALLNSDVFVITSRFEGHPMALIEAMNYGLPCLVTTGSNMRNEVEKFDAGWTADNEVESIKKAILTMLKEKKSIKAKGINARALAAKFSWEVLADKSHTAYINILK